MKHTFNINNLLTDKSTLDKYAFLIECDRRINNLHSILQSLPVQDIDIEFFEKLDDCTHVYIDTLNSLFTYYVNKE